jgi:hypothetical protein
MAAVVGLANIIQKIIPCSWKDQKILCGTGFLTPHPQQLLKND